MQNTTKYMQNACKIQTNHQKITFFEARTQRTTRQSMSMAQECPCRPYGAGRIVMESSERFRNRINHDLLVFCMYFALICVYVLLLSSSTSDKFQTGECSALFLMLRHEFLMDFQNFWSFGKFRSSTFQRAQFYANHAIGYRYRVA